MLVRIGDEIVNLGKVRKVTVEDVNLDSVIDDDIDGVLRALFAISILMETEEASPNIIWKVKTDEYDSKLENHEKTKEKVKQFALRKLSEMFGAVSLEF